MKAIVLKQNLMDAINIVQKAIIPKPTLSILEGIYIEADEKLKLIGNCYDLGIEYTCEADIKEKGCIVINSKIFGEIIRKLPDAPVCIETFDEYKVRIECLNSYYEIKGLEAETYPLPPSISNDNIITLSQSKLKDLIRQTIFSVGTEENRKIMTGALLQVQNGEISIVALDGFRMAVAHTTIKEEISFKVVIPGKNMNEILRILESSNDNITISSCNNLISFNFSNFRVVSNILDGEFMNYKSYIPSQFETVIQVATKEFIESLERTSLISSDDKKFPVRFTIKEDSLIITTTTEIGISKEQMKIVNSGENLHIGFNARYFIDALKVISDESIKVSFTSSIGPCIITSINSDRYLYLILPVRIKNN